MRWSRPIAVNSPEKVAGTVARVRANQAEWEAMGIEGRYHWLGKLRDWILDNIERSATRCRPKPARCAPTPARAGLRRRPDQLLRHQGGQVPRRRSVRPRSPLLASKKLTIHYRPHPVVGVISPWNFPLAMALGDSIPALQAGAAVVVKPSEFTPLSLIEMIEAWKQEIGGPDVFDCVHGTGEAGGALIDNVDYVQFTGSTGRAAR